MNVVRDERADTIKVEGRGPLQADWKAHGRDQETWDGVVEAYGVLEREVVKATWERHGRKYTDHAYQVTRVLTFDEFLRGQHTGNGGYACGVLENKRSTWMYGESFGDRATWIDHVERHTATKVYWDELEKAKAKIAELAPEGNPLPSRRRKVVRVAEPGADVDVGLLYSGSPRPFEVRRRRNLPRAVTISWDFTLSCGATELDFLRKGTAVVALTDWLTAQGYAVRLLPVAHSENIQSGGGTRAALWYEVKAQREPLDPGRLLAAMTPGMFRELAFSWWEWLCHPSRVAAGYGRCSVPPRYLRDLAGVDVWLGGDETGKQGVWGSLEGWLTQGTKEVQTFLKK